MSDKNGIFRNRLNIETNPKVSDLRHSYIKIYGVVNEKEQEDLKRIDNN